MKGDMGRWFGLWTMGMGRFIITVYLHLCMCANLRNLESTFKLGNSSL
jgi:hypothetical protein